MAKERVEALAWVSAPQPEAKDSTPPGPPPPEDDVGYPLDSSGNPASVHPLRPPFRIRTSR